MRGARQCALRAREIRSTLRSARAIRTQADGYQAREELEKGRSSAFLLARERGLERGGTIDSGGATKALALAVAISCLLPSPRTAREYELS